MKVRRAYMKRRLYCELYTKIVGILRDTPKYWGFFGSGLPHHAPRASDPHHIMLATRRWDNPRNLLALCHPVHMLVESRPMESFVWCLYRKFKLDELDLPWMEERMRKSLPSYLETDKFDGPDWHPVSRRWRDILIRKCGT